MNRADDDVTVTNALMDNGLLDAEGYLLPPDHKNVKRFTKRLFSLEELKQSGVNLSAADKLRLRNMHIAFDYYQEALEEEARDLDGDDDEEEFEEDEDEDVDEDEDEDEEEDE